MDVWFDSGSSSQAVLNQRPELSFPADLYLEGSDQYRGWFNASIIIGVAVTGHAPYRQLVSQGFVMDDKGHKMSKSAGNGISPTDVANKMGADIIRLWVASVDASADVPVSMGILQQTAESYRKIRNTMRFMLANTTDFDPKQIMMMVGSDNSPTCRVIVWTIPIVTSDISTPCSSKVRLAWSTSSLRWTRNSTLLPFRVARLAISAMITVFPVRGGCCTMIDR